jgi:hypothetical protein
LGSEAIDRSARHGTRGKPSLNHYTGWTMTHKPSFIALAMRAEYE